MPLALRMSSYSGEQKQTDELLLTKLTFLNELGKEVSGNAEKRLKWMEATVHRNSFDLARTKLSFVGNCAPINS